MFKKLLDSLSNAAYTLQTRAGREDMLNKALGTHRSKRYERDMKLKGLAHRDFREQHPEVQIWGLVDDYDGYVQYRKGTQKFCHLIENESWIQNEYYKYHEDKSLDEVRYEIILAENIPKINYLLSDDLEWKDYCEIYKTAFKVIYATVWLDWALKGGINESKEKKQVFNHVYNAIKEKEISCDSYDEFKGFSDVEKMLYIADALHSLDLEARIPGFTWQAINKDDLIFCKDYKENQYQLDTWARIFEHKFKISAGIYAPDIEKIFV
ncbi:MAG: hypothetical protein WCG87_12525 [Bacteroidota bacterium]